MYIYIWETSILFYGHEYSFLYKKLIIYWASCNTVNWKRDGKRIYSNYPTRSLLYCSTLLM